MRKALFAALAAAVILFLGAPTDRAAAMMIASPSAIGVAASEAGALVQVIIGDGVITTGDGITRHGTSPPVGHTCTAKTIGLVATATIQDPFGDWAGI
jgi:hypothetical protein